MKASQERRMKNRAEPNLLHNSELHDKHMAANIYEGFIVLRTVCDVY